jgi:homoserine dehydrogenase
LRKGKSVVSANKKMIAEHLPELLTLQQETGASFLYEAACCASIPVIRNLEEYYDNDLLQSISGIVNGSTNYILTKIAEEGLDFATALKQAQAEGFAESNPALDIEGIDAVNKLTILLTHAYGIVTAPAELVCNGITLLHEQDARYAKEKGYAIKLVAHAKKVEEGKVAAFVLPQFLKNDSRLFYVRNEYNGVVIESALADQQFFNGKGAGGFPTASAVISDLSALRYNYRYEYKKLYYSQPQKLADDYTLRVYFSFDVDNALPADFFENIEEWASNDQRSFVIGTIRFPKLQNTTWWKENGNSLIALPQAFAASKPKGQKPVSGKQLVTV